MHRCRSSPGNIPHTLQASFWSVLSPSGPLVMQSTGTVAATVVTTNDTQVTSHDAHTPSLARWRCKTEELCRHPRRQEHQMTNVAPETPPGVTLDADLRRRGRRHLQLHSSLSTSLSTSRSTHIGRQL